MARARNIKPAYFKNEYLAKLSFPARLLFIALWTLADCEGRLEDRPLRIKAETFPYDDDLDVDCLLAELASSPEKFIVRYVVATKPYIQIANFLKHQNPHKREKEAGSHIPPHPVQSRDQAGPKPGLAPDWHGTCPADSLILIPESLTPETDASASGCVGVNGLDKVSEENRRLAQEGMNYMASLNSPNHQNIGWIKGYLGIQFQELEQARPDIPKPEILTIWQDTCDLAVAKNGLAPKWFKTTFQNKLNAWVPNSSRTLLPEPASGESSAEKTRALLEFPFIRHIVTEQIFDVEDLEIRPDAPNGLTDHRGNYYPVGHLAGMMEVPAHA